MKVRKVIKSLERKGFEKTNSHHQMFVYRRLSDSRKTAVFTRVSQGSDEIGVELIKQMASQCKLRREAFQDLIDCPLSREEYEVCLRKDGFDV